MDMAQTIGAAQRPPIFSRPFLDWALCWVVLPNLAFCALWIVGGPPRGVEIVAGGVVGLVVRRSPFAVRFAAFSACLALAVLNFVSALFNLSVASLIASIRFLAELRPSASIEYVVVAVMLVVTLAGAWRLLKRPTAFELPWELMAAVGLVLTLAAADRAIASSWGGANKRIAPDDAVFGSAVAGSGFVEGAGGRHLLIVVVESLGLPRDAILRAKLFARWQSPDIADRYAVSAGSTPFFGSTTTGEVRELCGRWGDYPELAEGRHDCLPARMAAQGYRTAAYHSFSGDFFDRRLWYPNIGFEELHFRDDMVAAGASACPGVFPGACDRDVPAIIGNRLKAADTPQMVYWLTVNSHLPVPVDSDLRTQECQRFDPGLAREHPMSCRLFSLWSDLNASLGAMLADPALPPTDVLIVGDHGPPFLRRSERDLYDPGRVPWVLLRHRAAAEDGANG